jgi:ABC-2 type transport system permease protein
MAFQTAVQNAASKTAHVYALQAVLGGTLAGAGIDAPSIEDVRGVYGRLMGDNAAVKVNFAAGSQGYQERFVTNVHYLMGFNIFFVTFSIVFTIGGILEDKKLKTWNRIRISPVPGASVLAGNFIPAFAVGAVQMCIVLVLGQVLFGMDFGDRLLPILLVFAAFVLTATCFGLLLSALFNTYEQLNAGTPVILVAMGMLGGCMWPLSIVGSDILLGVANAMPQKWALQAAESLAAGGSLKGAAGNILVLLGMAVVFFAISVALYNKKQKA